MMNDLLNDSWLKLKKKRANYVELLPNLFGDFIIIIFFRFIYATPGKNTISLKPKLHSMGCCQIVVCSRLASVTVGENVLNETRQVLSVSL